MSDLSEHLDPALIDAVRIACEEHAQPSSVSRRLIAWLTQMSFGDPSTADHERLLENVFEVLETEEESGAG